MFLLTQVTTVPISSAIIIKALEHSLPAQNSIQNAETNLLV